jgi:hypothetical protein
MNTNPFTPRTLVLAVLSAALLGGCASFSEDGGLDAIQSATRTHIPQDVVWTRDDASRGAAQARVDALLAHPLSADDAVQIALLNNPGLQAAFNTLGIAEADWVAAQRLPNPGFSIGRLTQGSEVEWERSLHLNLARLLTMPMRVDIEQRLFEQTRRDLVLRCCGWRRTRAAPGYSRWPQHRPPTTSSRRWRQPRPVPNWRAAWRRWATGAA